ncbi:bacterial bifunctional deaminase-reductase [Ganoderma leucocontextum]|nr:bacterial bifunctional deaminase-reductase [Ganoderma leucocontextum]
MAATTAETPLPSPPAILRDLYGLSVSRETHPSIYYRDRDESTSPSPASPSPPRPFVTLTFAQSLDAKIAGAGGKQLILSGKESMVMTHWMRTLHDAILVGIGTAQNDDPQLNTRHLPSLPAGYAHSYRQPRPIVLDTHLRLSPDCKLIRNFQTGRGRRPWIVCGPRCPSRDLADTEVWAEREAILRAVGARIVRVRTEGAGGVGLISVRDLLTALRGLGVRSLMVEGGARVIRSFLEAARGRAGQQIQGRESSEGTGSGEGAKIIDALVVTVAPTIVGEAGVGYGSGLLADKLPTFEHVRTEVFGLDAVMAVRII